MKFDCGCSVQLRLQIIANKSLMKQYVTGITVLYFNRYVAI